MIVAAGVAAFRSNTDETSYGEVVPSTFSVTATNVLLAKGKVGLKGASSS